MTFFRLTAEERVAMGDRLRLARYVKQLTVRAVAAKFKVSTNTVTKWEHGAIPSADVRRRMAALYGVDEHLLFAEYEAHVEAARALLKPA